MRYILCGINAKYIHSNLGIFSLRAYARQHLDCEAEILIKEYTINHYIEQILQDLYEARPDVIAFSCYIWNISYVRELAEELKKVLPELHIWVGGPEVSYEVEEFLRENEAIELVMQGEGEETFTQLVDFYETGEGDLSRIPGIAFKKEIVDREPGQNVTSQDGSESRIYNTGFAPMVNMNHLPFVYDDFSLFEHKILYYETSRGCPFRCSYCLSSVDKRVRLRSLNLVFDELQRFLDARVPQVKFIDRTFNCNKEHSRAIWTYLLEHDNGRTNFHFEISSDLLEEEDMKIFEKMRTGLIQLEIGVQSTNPKTIDAINRHMDLPRLFENVDHVHRLGNIHQHLDLIAGLPFETYEQFKVSFNDLYAHAPDQLQLGFLKVLKGTNMKLRAKDYGLSFRGKAPYEVLKTKWLSYDEVILLKDVEELVELYYNSFQYTYTLKYVIPFFEDPFAFFEAFSEDYRAQGYHKVNHNRMEKYEILRAFLKNQPLELPYLDTFLLYDMYLRENIKARPAWAPDLSAYRKEWKEMYRMHSEDWFPQSGMDSKKAANQSHIEPFGIDLKKLACEGILEEREWLCLFDYTKRNPLNQEARTLDLSEGEGRR